MGYKINKITITNFKTFIEPFELELGGKNLLLFGENGSGKSSIYWSLYTHLQSCLKEQDIAHAGKYFDPDNKENLRNRYAAQNSDSGIVIEFIDSQTRVAVTYTDSKNLINTAIPGDSFIFDSLASSDFINYKYLYSIFDFRNSQEADIFGIFERDIFATGIFPETLHDIHGAETWKMNMRDWWEYLTKQAIAELPRRRNAGSAIIRTSAEYRAHQYQIGVFNRLLENYTQLIARYTNDLLTTDFPLPIRIKLSYRPLSFDMRDPHRHRVHNNRVIPPQIILTAELTDPTVQAGNRDIERPHTFLNEAKLARMAFAMRMAVINDKNAGAAARGAQILCMDDMLISLDMSNRLEVIDYILDHYSADYQLIIMTHDRALYRIVENKITKKKIDTQWLKKDLYCVDAEVSNKQYPYSELLNNKNPIIVALHYFSQHDYSACANTLRRCCEKTFRNLMPRNLQFDSNNKSLDLSALVGQMNQFTSLYGLSDVLPNLDIYREHILNPLSHDDLTSNMYREEMVRCIKDVEKFEEYTKEEIVSCNEHPEEFEMDIAGQSVVFEVRERWDYVITPDGQRFYKNVETIIKSSTMQDFAVNTKILVKKLYGDMCLKLRIAEDQRPQFEASIQHLPDAKQLSAY